LALATSTTITPTPAAVQNPANAPALQAQVIGHEGDGATILHTAFATLKLYTAQPLPTGTNMLFTVDMKQAPTYASVTPLTQEMETSTRLTRDWQHLDTAMRQLHTYNPPLASSMLQEMPTLGPQLTSGLLFFMAAIKAGHVGRWLEPRLIEQLKTSAPDFLKQLESDIAQMQQVFVNSPLNQWSPLMLPIMMGNDMQQLRLYVRKEPEQSHDPEGPRNQRFIIEIDLSQLGDLQFDGFVRSHDKKTAFDLVIRTSKALDSDVSSTIRTIFENALQVTGLKGQLGFQTGVQHFVRPLTDIQPPRAGESAHTILA
jgi:hypothetical protein